MIEIEETSLPGVIILSPKKFSDERGFFSETYNKKVLAEYGLYDNFKQDNHSYSQKAGTIRGLHYQKAPFAQAKLVRVLRGSVFDVAVDIRPHSPHFLHWVGVELSAQNWKQLYIPIGFAHGFLTLEEDCEFLYKVTNYYNTHCENSIRYDDPEIGICWPWDKKDITLSVKDSRAPFLKDIELFAGAERKQINP